VTIVRLSTLDAFIAFDFDDSPVNAGGTRFAPDVTEHEASLLARAMTYKFGVIGVRTGGAKGVIRGTPDQHDILLKTYCEEIRPLVQSAKFLTGPDLGTSERDFAPLRDPNNRGIMAREPHLEDLLTGFGVVIAAETAIGSLDGRTFAVEGFGKVGGGVAREAVRRGARVVAVSTLEGVVGDARGIDVELLVALRSAHGDGCVRMAGYDFDVDPMKLFDVEADVLVPGARTGVITNDIAARLKTPWIAPAANVPYRADAIATLQQRRIRYLPDFVCNAGATIGYTSNTDSAADVFAVVEEKISSLMSMASSDPRGPFEGARAIAEEFISSWHDVPSGPPLA
jgi:glutamate dehydrogenase/leucine dehydrogenase